MHAEQKMEVRYHSAVSEGKSTEVGRYKNTDSLYVSERGR